MIRKAITGVGIGGAGTCFPGDLLGPGASLDSEAALLELLGEEAAGVDWRRIQERTGVVCRGWTRGRGIGTLELAVGAGRAALDHAGWQARDLDAVVVATCTPPHITKNLSAQVAGALGTTAAGLDLRAGGAGGLEAWLLGAQLVTDLDAPGPAKVLVIAAEATSHYANPEDHGNSLLFGDGAGALCLTSTPDTGGLVTAVSGTAHVPGTPFTVRGALPPEANEDYTFQQPDHDYLAGLADTWAMAATALADQLSALESPVDHFLPYAVTPKQLHSAAAPLGLAPTEALAFLAQHGCLGCAGPIALLATRLRADPAPDPNDLFASLAVGGGVSWCGLAWRGGLIPRPESNR